MRNLKLISLTSLIAVLFVFVFGSITFAQLPTPNDVDDRNNNNTVQTTSTNDINSNSGQVTPSSTISESEGVPASAPVPPPAPAEIPQEQGYIDTNYTVTSAVVITIATSTNTTTATTSNQVIQLRGKAEPNIYVTLYIYSTPIIVSVKTDNEGNWSYNIDKELENGQHTVYVAKVNNSGAVVAKSNPIFFTKTEASVQLNSSDAVPVNQPNVNFFQSYFWWIMALILILIIILAITIIGMSAQKNEVLENASNPNDPTVPPTTPGSTV